MPGENARFAGIFPAISGTRVITETGALDIIATFPVVSIIEAAGAPGDKVLQHCGISILWCDFNLVSQFWEQYLL